jgi:hypothetical protein
MSMERNVQLTEREISNLLKKEIVNNGWFLSTSVITVLSAIAAGLFASSELFLFLLAGAGLSAITGVVFLVNKMTIGRHRAVLCIIEKIRLETQKDRQLIEKQVFDGLTQFNDRQGLKQLTQLHAKFDAFSKVLNLQFDKDEITHKRYLTSAEQLYFGALDNLRALVMMCYSVEAINPEHIKNQLKGACLDDVAQLALSERLSIYESTKTEMLDVLSINEQVMTKLDEVTSKLGSIQTKEGLSDVRLDTAMSEIRHLINRTEKYDIKNM